MFPGRPLEIFADSAPPYTPVYLSPNQAGIPNLTPEDFGAASGTITILSVNGIATPLPDALPMFGAALLGFMGFAAWRSRRTPNE
jgi:hypothetical protein